MQYPNATYKPVQNHGGPITRIQGLVLHVQEGNGSLYGWFNNPASQVSAHFWISKLGAMEQYIDTGTVAWAEAAGNPYYLSIETEGFVTEPLTESQIDGVAELLVWMNQQFQTPLVGPVAHGANGFTQHCNPDGTPDPAWGNHTCPGPIRLGQMTNILTVANGQPGPEPIEIPEGEVLEMVVVNINGVAYAVTTILTHGGQVVEIRRQVDSLGLPSTGANTNIINLTNQWPAELS